MFELYLQSLTFPRSTIFVMELIPPFGLYRGLYELGEYAFQATYTNGAGMAVSDLSDPNNGMASIRAWGAGAAGIWLSPGLTRVDVTLKEPHVYARLPLYF